MGTNILVPGADFSASAVGFNAAVESGLQGLWFFNRGVRASAKNLALGGVNAEVLGTPSDQGAFLRFKGGESFFQTAIGDTEELTHIVAVKSTDTMADQAHSPMFVSNFGSGSKAGYVASSLSGASIYSNASTSLATMSASRYTDGTNTTVTSAGTSIATTLANWSLVASRVRTDRAQRDNLTTAVAAAATFTSQARVLAAGDFRIGSSYSLPWQGYADIAAVAMYDRYISDAELTTIGVQMRNVLAHLVITV
ncbi:hypothetical protein [Sinorhizobium medicae]|uniref:hypothetical protein n=1 Tax=Sinorhizobium medicae TaxID=110321 RepID=UPI000C7964C8|nr:hypothetical protein [Sinorhizobium medicae]PLT95002.1 hypothetical protein BMJ32_30445 [Sinorhizobium medicae]